MLEVLIGFRLLFSKNAEQGLQGSHKVGRVFCTACIRFLKSRFIGVYRVDSARSDQGGSHP